VVPSWLVGEVSACFRQALSLKCSYDDYMCEWLNGQADYADEMAIGVFYAAGPDEALTVSSHFKGSLCSQRAASRARTWA